ncbi:MULTISPECIES: hypothetical protein [Rhodomicrobium]|uniref:hypothetical protein n=1 Tax=Rhodomicrobium TaxID=1068 RepID=UPI000B4ABD0F|nr:MULTISPECIES: hypothetical protein [Rhodomicrobium]
MTHTTNQQNLSDAALAGGLVSAPAWSPWLTELNQVLTTATLVVGLAFGLIRLWAFWRERRNAAKH